MNFSLFLRCSRVSYRQILPHILDGYKSNRCRFMSNGEHNGKSASSQSWNYYGYWGWTNCRPSRQVFWICIGKRCRPIQLFGIAPIEISKQYYSKPFKICVCPTYYPFLVRNRWCQLAISSGTWQMNFDESFQNIPKKWKLRRFWTRVEA